jgi:putative exporter of polyketide antibiotics
MKIAKPMLLILTPIGIVGGLYEAYKFGGGLAFLMLALLSLISVAMISVVRTIRRERREEEARLNSKPDSEGRS